MASGGNTSGCGSEIGGTGHISVHEANIGVVIIKDVHTHTSGGIAIGFEFGGHGGPHVGEVEFGFDGVLAFVLGTSDEKHCEECEGKEFFHFNYCLIISTDAIKSHCY